MLIVEPEMEAPETCDTGSPAEVLLADGSTCLLGALGREQLAQLQWEQEQEFAAAILAAPAGSDERQAVVAQAYDTVCSILAALQSGRGEPLVMGFDRRYADLVCRLLANQFERRFHQPCLFEVGFGSGALLKEVRSRGFAVGGIEISSTMRDQCLRHLGERHADSLLLGDLRDVDATSLEPKPTLVFWNDVLEHLAPDEAADYVSAIYAMLPQGGELVTITPHWALRPSDVTVKYCPLRTEARGLHLKEYRLREVAELMHDCGFQRVATPLLVTKKRMLLSGSGMRRIKEVIEDQLEHLPVRLAHLACRGLGLSVTIATK